MANEKVLIVDDDPDLTEALQTILQSRDYVVCTASNVEDGMAKAKAEVPDLMILDVMMSTWQDGFNMARSLREDPKFEKTPILMLTGVKDKTGMDFKEAAGDPSWLPVDGFLDKPVESNVLLAEVEKLLGKGK